MRDLNNLDHVALQRLANLNRIKVLDMVYEGNSGHLGGAFSAVDIITYLGECVIDYNNPIDRDRFLLSKGHAVAALYAELHALGLVRDEELHTFRKINSRLQGHTNVLYLPETDITTGLLGQGLSYGVGMALAKKLKKSSCTIYIMIGDGEMHEGQIWEALMEGSHYKLDNLVLIVDRNTMCSHQLVENVMNIEPLYDRLTSFGWYVRDIDGHDMREIGQAIEDLKQLKGQPKCLIAHTKKAKGVSFMENNGKWHRSIPNEEEYNKAREELLQLVGGTI